MYVNVCKFDRFIQFSQLNAQTPFTDKTYNLMTLLMSIVSCYTVPKTEGCVTVGCYTAPETQGCITVG